jgi:hypothetical protein
MSIIRLFELGEEGEEGAGARGRRLRCRWTPEPAVDADAAVSAEPIGE